LLFSCTSRYILSDRGKQTYIKETGLFLMLINVLVAILLLESLLGTTLALPVLAANNIGAPESQPAGQTGSPGRAGSESGKNDSDESKKQATEVSAEAAAEVKTSSNADLPAESTGEKITGQRLFRASLDGSMCVACLKQLQVRLKRINGITHLKVQRFTEPSPSGREKKRTTIEILYDGQKLDQKKIRKAIRQDDFAVSHVSDEDFPDQQVSDFLAR